MSKNKKRFFSGHAKSSALVVSLMLHALLLVLALSFVAVQVVIKKDPTFEAKPVTRPQMKLKKLTVPVKMKKTREPPRLRKTIVTQKKLKSIELQLPEITGVVGGMGNQGGGGLGVGFNFDMPDLFGGNRRGGSSFVGTFYDLKQMKDGRSSEIGELIDAAESKDYNKDPNLKKASQLYKDAVARFLSNWNPSRLDNYFKAPREKYATSFMIPRIEAAEAPKAFGVEKEVKPEKWVALYRGEISAPTSGKYRFWGRGDDVLVVRIKKRTVLDGSYSDVSEWQSSDPDSGKFSHMYKRNDIVLIGDWFFLEEGKPVAMDVLIGEEPGGEFFSMLLIEKDGETYPMRNFTYTNKDTGEKEVLQRPVLPVFKTEEPQGEIIQQMKINGDWATVKGPTFGAGK